MESSYSASFFSSKEMESMFQEVFGLLLIERDFQYVGKSTWVRDTNAGFKHLLYFYPFRPGADYFPYGALSFDYVPRIEAGRIRLRPDPKHTRVHLVVTNVGWGSGNRIERSRATAKQQCQNLCPTIVDVINESIDPIKAVADALELLRREKDCKGVTFYHYPETALSYAFTLAKMGCTSEAEVELNALFKEQDSHYPPETQSEICRLLSQTTA